MNKLDWKSFEPRFHKSWWNKMQPIIESEMMWNIYQELKKNGKNVLPGSGDVFKAFTMPFEKIRAIWVGMCPYHTPGMADGLCFSCANYKLSPSLSVLYSAMEDDLKEKITKIPQLDYLKDGGILMLNSSLTTLKGIAGAHTELWKPFMKVLFEDVLDVVTGIPVIMFGKEAEYVEQFLTPNVFPLKVKHPAYYARLNQPMQHKNLFSWMNTITKKNTGREIIWDNQLPF